MAVTAWWRVRRPAGGAGDADERGEERDFELRVFRAARVVALLIAVVSITFGAAAGDDAGDGTAIVGVAVMIAAAAAGVGVLLGFLFGIPRTLQREDRGDVEGPRYLANTNLEQISDWLTKILVGISLVQIGNAGSALARLADALGPMLGDEPASPGFGLALCIVASLSGFLLSYLWTRVRLKRELQIADRDIETTVRMVVDAKASADAEALSLVDRQLSGQNAPTDGELAKALAKATQPILVQAYGRAEGVRARSWRDPSQAEQHDRTIPVFRALIANDPDHRFHRHFGSLGFALKDKDPPDLGGAIEALTTAVTVRGDSPTSGFRLYEWSRAASRILALGDPAAATPDQRAEIEADLRVAAGQLGPGLFEAGHSADPTVQAVAAWMAEQGLSYAGLGS